MRFSRTTVLAALLLRAASATPQCTPVDCLGQLPAWGGLCAEGFVTGRVGQPYADAISFHITNACTPATLFDPALTGVSVRITQVTGIGFSQLPAGLTGATDFPAYTPPANGCGSLSGVPLEAGTFAASVDLVANVNAWPFSLTCGGFGPIAQNGNPVSFPRGLVILPDPSFIVPAAPLCATDAPFNLVPTGTTGGVFSGPGVSGDQFDPAVAGIGIHVVKYAVSAQQGAAVAPAADSLSLAIEVVDCAPPCDALSGTLTRIGDVQVCRDPGGTAIAAVPNGDAVLPDGHVLRFLFSNGLTPVVQGILDDPTVTFTEPFTLVQLTPIVYDPSTFDLAFVELGVTTVLDIEDSIQAQGACASLSYASTSIDFAVADCCTAYAGTLGGLDFIPCLVPGGFVELVGIPGGDAVVPAGYALAYVLTQGAGLTILAAGPDPVFQVSETGVHAIHTLVYDPTTFDPGQIEWGVATAAEVNALFIGGGGSICASLDLIGAPYDVVLCSSSCDADAGTLSGGGAVCLEDGEATLEATPNGDAVVPAGFTVAYALSQSAGLVIIDAASVPVFTVSEPGSYAIHTLVYDPAVLDPGFIQPGITTAFDVAALFLQGGGALCGSLDAAGAGFIVEVCSSLPDLGAEGIRLAPNPTDGAFTVQLEGAGAADLEVIDGGGRVVHRQWLMECDRPQAVVLSDDLGTGLYAVRVTHGRGRAVHRLLICR